MNIFFDNSEINKNIEAASYGLYCIIIGVLYLWLNLPVINLVTNLILFFLLTLNYSAPLKFRIWTVIIIYATLLTIESFVVLFSHFIMGKLLINAESELIIQLIATKMISYMIMLLLSNYKMIKKSQYVPFIHWVSVVILPLGTLCITVILIENSRPQNMFGIILGIVTMLFINIFVFYLYDSLVKFYSIKIDGELLKQQVNSYMKQMEIFENTRENIRIVRHDIKNHMLSLKSLIEKNDKEEALKYIEDITDYVNYPDDMAVTPNLEVNSILNYKINQAEKLSVKVELNLNLPEKLNIKSFDLSVILGNLMDNAISASSRLNGNKKIKLNIEFDRNILYISITNLYNGKLKYENGNLLTSDINKENHGLGLKSVKRSVERYNGAMTINHTDEIFTVDVLLYNITYD